MRRGWWRGEGEAGGWKETERERGHGIRMVQKNAWVLTAIRMYLHSPGPSFKINPPANAERNLVTPPRVPSHGNELESVSDAGTDKQFVRRERGGSPFTDVFVLFRNP